MLVLTLNRDEQVRIGDDIVLQLCFGMPKVKIGITAPKSVSVHREPLVIKTKGGAVLVGRKVDEK